MTADPTTPDGRAAIRERAERAQAARNEIGHCEIRGWIPAKASYRSIAASQADVPALLDALDRTKQDHEENLRAGLRHKHRAEKAEAALARVRELVMWSDPARLGGTPCVRDTRTPVDQITALLDDFSDEEITSYYPAPEVWQVAILRALDGES